MNTPISPEPIIHAIDVHKYFKTPRGVVHAFRNDGDTDAKFLAVASPGVFGPSYFLDIAEVLARSQGGPPDIRAMGEVMRAARRPGGIPAIVRRYAAALATTVG